VEYKSFVPTMPERESRIEVRTHPNVPKPARETTISIPSNGQRAHVFAEQSAIMRKLLRSDVADIVKLTLFEGDVVSVWAYVPIGAVSIAARPGTRNVQRVSKVHSVSGLLGGEEMFRGGLGAAIEEGCVDEEPRGGHVVDVPIEVREARRDPVTNSDGEAVLEVTR